MFVTRICICLFVSLVVFPCAPQPKSKYFESQLDVNKLAWKEVCSPMFEQQLAHHGPFLLGEKVSALDPLLMVCSNKSILLIPGYVLHIT